jgi:UDP-glucose 4-epimerase
MCARKVARAVKKKSSNIEKVLVTGGAGFIGSHLADIIMPSGTNARVAAYVAQIMNRVASNFDKREINVQLDELQRLVMKQMQTQRMEDLSACRSTMLTEFLLCAFSFTL